MEKINKYQNGKIYKIISFSHPDLVYYGSTCNTLSKRFGEHQTHFKKPDHNRVVNEILKFDDAKILLVELFPCNSKIELVKREGEYILNNNCVNKKVAGRTKEEYRIQNRENILIAKRKYRENNIEKCKLLGKINYEKKKEILKEIIMCSCGSKITRSWKTQHEKTIKHLNFLNLNNG